MSLTINDISDEGSFYVISFIIDGKDSEAYVTKDGEYLINPLAQLTGDVADSTNANTQATEIPKSDMPDVELFIWSYCPYGVQAQAPLSGVANLMENYANFKTVLYYGGHGEFEVQQNKIQECIQELYPKKYWDYASRFVDEIYPLCSSSRTVDCDKTESVKLMKSLGIDSNSVLSCVETRGEVLISEASALANQAGVTGSPTLFINGVKANVERNEEAFKSAVCEAFNNAPEECATVLSSETGASQGNC